MDGMIHKKIIEVMRAVPAIGKTRDNKQQGFKFRGIDDVFEALNPLLREHGIYCRPEVIETRRDTVATLRGGEMFNTQITVRYNFVAEDGSETSVTTIGEAQDSGDKSSIKAQSISMKVAYLQMFCIPVAGNPEDRDPDYTSYDNKAKPPHIRLQAAIEKHNITADTTTKWLEHFGAATLSDLTGAQIDAILRKLQKTKGE